VSLMGLILRGGSFARHFRAGLWFAAAPRLWSADRGGALGPIVSLRRSLEEGCLTLKQECLR